VRARAVDFARRIEQEAGNESGSQIRLAWQIALGREPSADEIGSGVGFLERRQSDRAARDAGLNPSDARRLVLTDLCQTLFALNEFVYVD
jgi:hypothetical protein